MACMVAAPGQSNSLWLRATARGAGKADALHMHGFSRGPGGAHAQAYTANLRHRWATAS